MQTHDTRAPPYGERGGGDERGNREGWRREGERKKKNENEYVIIRPENGEGSRLREGGPDEDGETGANPLAGGKERCGSPAARATKPPLQIKLYSSKERAERGEEDRGRESEKSRRTSCRGKIRLCGLAPVCYAKTTVRATGMEGEGETGEQRWWERQ